jgi:hypothetical protein
MAELTAQLRLATERQKDAERDLQALKSAVPVPHDFITGQPLYMSEQEEDLQHQLDTGQITKEELAEILKEAGLENTQVEFS